VIEFQQESLFQLYGQQKTLYDALVQYNGELAKMYYGSLKVLADKNNPDRLSLAAHGIRELIEKSPLYICEMINTDFDLNNKVENLRDYWIDVLTSYQLEAELNKKISEGNQITKELESFLDKTNKFFQSSNTQQSLKDKVSNLKGRWESFQRSLKPFQKLDNTIQITPQLKAFLKEIYTFFELFKQAKPTRDQEREQFFANLDPLKRHFPPYLTDERIKGFKSYNEYFQGVAHHNPNVELNDFDDKLTLLENFLIKQLAPQTLHDFSYIDSIIQEGEINDKF
jgi:hypothetical protein